MISFLIYKIIKKTLVWFSFNINNHFVKDWIVCEYLVNEVMVLLYEKSVWYHVNEIVSTLFDFMLQ